MLGRIIDSSLDIGVLKILVADMKSRWKQVQLGATSVSPYSILLVFKLTIYWLSFINIYSRILFYHKKEKYKFS